ncbi:MAG: uracil-DNA glycosylase [Campylobacterota bacterium]|nr:uracil-DNA glycosylase [Campylobacterota bacterium]
MTIDPKIDSSWKSVLADEFQKPYFSELKAFLVNEKSQYTVYPSGENIFNAFNTTHFDKVKVVIIGQDPYHGQGQAHGLAFSVQDNVKFPPSLLNIFKEYCDDLDLRMPANGNLSKWAEQGVFLLNTVLTVRANQAHSHKERGWETFTDFVIHTISERKEHIVFILWGKPAQMKASLIDERRHLILRAPHPSPLSAYRGFFGSHPFSKTNAYLRSQNINPIDWEL